MNDADRDIVERLKGFRQQDAAGLIESQAAEIERLRAIEDWVMAFQDGCDGIYKLATEMFADRATIKSQAERIEELERKRTSTEGDVDTLTDAVGLPRGVGYEELLASVIRLREAAVAKTGQPGPTT